MKNDQEAREAETSSRRLIDDVEQFSRVSGRRNVVGWLLGLGAVGVLGCGSDGDADDGAGGDGSDGSAGSGGSGGSSDGTCSTIPSETEGPYPGDGTNNGGTNALTLSGIVRSDIRRSVGDASGMAVGIPLTIELTLVRSGSCAALANHAIYLWHCDRDGLYSMYTLATENYLRGVQETDADGKVTFETIFPAAYPGRWPHAHFEIYESLDAATSGDNNVWTSQLALPEDACNEVFTTEGYEESAQNMAQTPLSADNVFSDGAELQIPSITGNVDDGYVVKLTVAID